MATTAPIQAPVLPFAQQEKMPAPQSISQSVAADHSLLEIDHELDQLSDRIQDELEENGEPSPDSLERFQTFCDAYGEKIDRIGRFIRVMEARSYPTGQVHSFRRF